MRHGCGGKFWSLDYMWNKEGNLIVPTELAKREPHKMHRKCDKCGYVLVRRNRVSKKDTFEQGSGI